MLGKFAIVRLLKKLEEYNQLKSLNISQNRVEDWCAFYIEKLLEESESIKELYLHWNILKGDGAAKIFSGAIKSKQLRVLDISSNAIGLGIDAQY